MSRSDAERVGDILSACSRLSELVDEGRTAFDDSWRNFSAACYELAVVGEALSGLSPQFLEAHPELPVRAAKSLRNLVMHEYFRSEPDIVWDTMVADVPDLERILSSLGSAEN